MVHDRTDSEPLRKSLRGFSLVELIIAIALMAILISAATMSFSTWQAKAKVDEQTRTILSDLNDARTRAFTQKRVSGIVFNPSSYVLKTYTSETEYSTATNAATKGTTVYTKTLRYGLTKAGASIANTPVIFDTSGFTNDWFTIFVDPTYSSASVNCIVISAARVNMGKLNGTACEFK